MELKYTIREGTIFLRSRFEDRVITASIFGARWDKNLGSWKIPATPAGAMGVIEAFYGGDIPDAVPPDLLELARPIITSPMDRVEVTEAAQLEGMRVEDLFALADAGANWHERYATMWRHQRAAYWWALSRKAVLLDAAMGSGKTRVTIEVANDSPGVNVVLVSTPLSTIPHWRAQIKRFSVRDPLFVDLTDRSTRQAAIEAAKTMKRFDGEPRQIWLLCNRERTWRSPLAELFLEAPPDLVIYDEVHSIKAPGGRASMYAAKLGAKVAKKIGMSGTPLAHSPLDGYGIFRFLDPGVFGLNFHSFRSRFAVMGGYGNHQVLKFVNLEEYRRRYLWLTYEIAADVLDLPEHHHVEHEIKLPARAREVYASLRDEFVADLEGGKVTASNALSKLLRLQQITSGFAPIDDGGGKISELHGEKQRALREILEELPDDERLVVFCRFIHDLDAVHRVCAELKVASCELSGRRKELFVWEAEMIVTPNGSVVPDIEAPPRVIAVQIQAGGLGVDSLKLARHCVFYSLGFSLSEYEQALARVKRPGQERTVFFHHLIAVGTVDRYVYRALRERREVLNEILQRRKLEED